MSISNSDQSGMTVSSQNAQYSSTGSAQSFFSKQNSIGLNGEKELEVHKLLSASLSELSIDPSQLQESTIQNQLSSLLPISLLLDEMRSDYSSTRTYCLQNLDTIALVLGTAKAKGLLGGFISNLLKDQDEGVEDVPEEMQVMLTLLNTLPKLIKYIGGPDSAIVLLQPLVDTLPERQKEETKQMYLATIIEISKKMKDNSPETQKIFQEFLDSKLQEFQKGSNSEQLTCLSLISSISNLAEKEKWFDWKNLFQNIFLTAKDQTFKRKCIIYFKAYIANSNTKYQLEQLFLLFQEIQTNLSDNQQSMVFMCLGQFLNHNLFQQIQEDIKKKIMNILNDSINLQELVQTTNFVDSIYEILTALDQINEIKLITQITDIYISLFKSQELEIKNKCVNLLTKIFSYIKPKPKLYNFEIYNRIIQDLLQEKNINVKLNLSDFLTYLLSTDFKKRNEEKSSYISNQETFAIIQSLLQLLQQDDSDFRYKFYLKQKSFDYLLYYISIANQFNKSFNTANELNLFAKSILSISKLKNWRMRQQGMIFLAKVVEQINIYINPSHINEGLLNEMAENFKVLFIDRIHTVREETGNVIKNQIFIFIKTLCSIFGMLQLKDAKQTKKLALKLLDFLGELLDNSNYLIRLGFVLGLKKSLLAIQYEEKSNNSLKQMLLKIMKDKIPNVKLALLEVLLHYVFLKPESQEWLVFIINEILQPLKRDQDEDVKEASKNLEQFIYDQYKQ